MSTYHPHLNRRDRRAPRAAAIWTTPPENETERRERIAAERETRRRLDADREARAAARREQRAATHRGPTRAAFWRHGPDCFSRGT